MRKAETLDRVLLSGTCLHSAQKGTVGFQHLTNSPISSSDVPQYFCLGAQHSSIGEASVQQPSEL